MNKKKTLKVPSDQKKHEEKTEKEISVLNFTIRARETPPAHRTTNYESLKWKIFSQSPSAIGGISRNPDTRTKKLR